MTTLLERPERLLDKGLGYSPDLPDPRDLVFGVTHSPAHLPVKVDLEPAMPAVYDQLNIGSCVGNGVAACMEFEEVVQHELLGTPSRLYIYWHGRYYENSVNSDAGLMVRTGLKVAATLGVPPETDWPYDTTRFMQKPPDAAEADAAKHVAMQYARLVPGVGASLRTCLAGGHPFTFGFSVPRELEELTAAQPVLHYPDPATTQFIGGHCVVCVGYDYTMQVFPEPMFKIRNSWGPAWGAAGHYWMPARFLGDRQLSRDFWTIRKVS